MSETAVGIQEQPDLVRKAIDTETLQSLYSLERRLPVDQIKAAFVSEFSYLDPDIESTMATLQENTSYVDFVVQGHQVRPEVGGLTTPFYQKRNKEPWNHRIQVETSDSPDQDQHVLTHEWIHGMSIQDVGKSWVDGDLKKQEIKGRIGFKKMKAIIVTHPDGRKEVVDQALTEPLDDRRHRMLENLTEWKARRMGMKYFPEKYNDLHKPFKTGYQGVSVIEYLEETAEAAGKKKVFTEAADRVLVLGDEGAFIALVDTLFGDKKVYAEVLTAFGQEIEAEQQQGQGKITPQTAIYPDLVSRLNAA